MNHLFRRYACARMILIEVEGDFTEGARLRATFLKPVILSPMWAKDLPRCVQLTMLQVRLFHEELERARRRKNGSCRQRAGQQHSSPRHRGRSLRQAQGQQGTSG